MNSAHGAEPIILTAAHIVARLKNSRLRGGYYDCRNNVYSGSFFLVKGSLQGMLGCFFLFLHVWSLTHSMSTFSNSWVYKMSWNPNVVLTIGFLVLISISWLWILCLENGVRINLKSLTKFLKNNKNKVDEDVELCDDFSHQFSEWLGKKIYKRQNVGYVVCVKGSSVIGCIDGTWQVHKDRNKAVASLADLKEIPEGLEVREIVFDYKYY